MNMIKSLNLFLVCLLVVLLASCATIISGKNQTVSFVSEPPGATVILGGRTLGVTPMTINLERKKDQALVFEKEGYNTVTMPLTTTLNGVFWGNIVIGGLLGSTTDGFTGAMHEYSPSAYHITMTKKGSAFFTPKGKIKAFILSNYSHIMKEANTSPKEYMPALCSLLEIPEIEHGVVMENMKHLIDNSDNSLVFAEKVINNYFTDIN